MKMKLKKAKIQNDEKGMILDLSDDLVMGGKKDEKGSNYSPIPHKDLVEAFQELKPALIKTLKLDWIFNILQPNLLTTPEEHNANKVLKEKIWKGYEEAVSAIEVTGFSLSGEEANRGVIVTGKQTVHGKTVAINSPRIVFNHSEFGIEEELETDIKRCIIEIQAYIGGKHGESSEPNLFNQPAIDEEEKELSVADLERLKEESYTGTAKIPKKSAPKKRSSPLKKAK